jgi:hypothetical protein
VTDGAPAPLPCGGICPGPAGIPHRSSFGMLLKTALLAAACNPLAPNPALR